jgi:hypothetical protein
MLLLAAAPAAALHGAAAGTAATSVQAFTASADGFVSAGAPNASYGRARSLRLRAQPVERAYLRFRVAGLRGDVASARLRVFVTRSGRGTLQVRAVVRRRWTERSLRYRTAPRLARTVATAHVSRGWRSFDVSSLVRQAGVVELALVAPRGAVSVASRETRSKPTLLVNTAPVLLAAGDIASCDSNGDEATAALLRGVPATIAAIGDLAYESGTPAEFANCYGPSWGRFRSSTHPALGNREYLTAGAAGYFGYWGASAGTVGAGYYSYDLGSWHIVVLNSNCAFVACSAGSLQETWLRADLAQHSARCTLAYWHHPLFSSTPGTATPAVQPLWQALYDAGADVVLTGHAHNYQRFAPQSPSGAADTTRGIREFVVGTGGKARHLVGTPIANQQRANDTEYGVLRLTLLAGAYRWRFVPHTGGAFRDAGSGVCH